MKVFVLDVGPKLFQDLRNGIGGQLGSPILREASKIAIVRIIGQAHARGDAIAYDFCEIESRSALIGAGYDDSG
jgi:hypothetical protein